MVGRRFGQGGEHSRAQEPDPAFRPPFHGLRAAGRAGVPPLPAGGSARGREPRHRETETDSDRDRRETEVTN